MRGDSNKQAQMKVFPKGQVVIPIDLRKKHHIEIGDLINIVSTDEGILLKPASKKHDHPSLTDQLFGIFGQQAQKVSSIRKRDIAEATKKGFVKGWLK